jgi:acyl-CoA reductase-like NAD-dependent aldehyde dehydrogenase
MRATNELPVLQCLIGGQPVASDSVAEVRDPGSGELIATVAEATLKMAEAAVAAAHDAFPEWAASEERPVAMIRCAEVVAAHADELAKLLTREQGKPLVEASREIARLGQWLRHFASVPLETEALVDDGTRWIRVKRRPLGVVAAITPWNFPISLLAWKLAPAFAAGNTVVVKPSPFTPATTLRLAGLLAEVLPPGVLNVVTGGAEVGAFLVGHPLVRKVAFTGSATTGRSIMQTAGPALKRVTLELGGNDPAIVLDDARVDELAERLFWSAFYNCGQVCIAVKRVFVAQPLYAPLVDALAARAAVTRVGHGLDAMTELGPLNNAPQRDRVEELVRAARRSGASIVAGGQRLDAPGYFYAPTIVSDIDITDPLVAEEQFGPVLPVIPYTNIQDAISFANAGEFGLGASIWTADPARAEAVADQLDVGTVWVNHHMEALPEAPFGGAKASGIGYENGLPGLDEYVQLQVRNERR